MPPILVSGDFEHYNLIVIVPCKSAAAYRLNPRLELFSNIEEVCNGIDDLEVMGYMLWGKDASIIVESADGGQLSGKKVVVTK